MENNSIENFYIASLLPNDWPSLGGGGFALLSPTASPAIPSYTKEEFKGPDQLKFSLDMTAIREPIERGGSTS